MSQNFPFSAIVGQEHMKLAMILTAIDPTIGGVLVFGDRGTGKSTAVRSLAALLPEISVIDKCPVNSEFAKDVPDWVLNRSGKKIKRETPVVDLPLGVSEDRVTGALDIERALTGGEKVFQPGLLAKANRGYLYIDEVNLLEDHIVDLLLDVAQSGENLVEREGLSIRHAAKFVLVGSGNPEEGELRPQLLDRFGLSVDVTSPTNIDDRVSIIERRDEFEQNKKQFVKRWASEDAKIKIRILSARKKLTAIKSDKKILRDCADLCISLGTDGLRGELSLIRASRALAAYEGAKSVERMHLKEISILALAHRLRRDPLDEAGSLTRVKRAVADLIE